MLKLLFVSVVSLMGLSSCAQKDNAPKTKKVKSTMTSSNVKLDTSGYSGGTVPNPTYEQVCSKTTGHAECLNIVYDPAKISFDELLEVFWKTHDPTTLNRQGADVGTQYRSVVFYHDAEQKAKTEKYKAALDKSGAFDNPIVTTLEPFSIFYPAEAEHQNYYNNNGSQGYCQFVIRPKVEKFEKVFKSKLKKY
jgi:peptide-methionine (S)-S-oxide reductase